MGSPRTEDRMGKRVGGVYRCRTSLAPWTYGTYEDATTRGAAVASGDSLDRHPLWRDCSPHGAASCAVPALPGLVPFKLLFENRQSSGIR
jgi:hypothetical protein